MAESVLYILRYYTLGKAFHFRFLEGFNQLLENSQIIQRIATVILCQSTNEVA